MWYKAPNGTWWNIGVSYYAALNEDSPTIWYIQFFGPASIPQFGPYPDEASAQEELDKIIGEIGPSLAS